MTVTTKFNVGDTIRDVKRKKTFEVIHIKVDQWKWNGEMLYGVRYRGPGPGFKRAWCWEQDAERAS